MALLHQHRRTKKTASVAGKTVTYIEATRDDIALANRLAAEVLGRSLDELAPQTRRLLLALDDMVNKACERLSIERDQLRFTRKDVREHTAWSDFQVRTHLARLIELEHVLVHRGGRGQSFVYELTWDGAGRDGQPFLSGLIEPDALSYDANIEHPRPKFEGPTSPHRAPNEHPLATPRKRVCCCRFA